MHTDAMFGVVEKNLFSLFDKKVGKSVILCQY
jgi:hypothetical protein